MWSKKFESCINCSTTKVKHEAHGLCKKCYELNRVRDSRAKPKGEKKWAKEYDECVNCKTTNHPYHGKGLCSYCRARTPEYKRYIFEYESRPNVILRRKLFKKNSESYKLTEKKRLKKFKENNPYNYLYYGIRNYSTVNPVILKKQIERLEKLKKKYS